MGSLVVIGDETLLRSSFDQTARTWKRRPLDERLRDVHE
jgi:hypothetical protein